MKVGIGSDIPGYIFFLYFVRENSQVTGFQTETCPTVSYLLLAVSCQRAIIWPLAMAITTDKGLQGRVWSSSPKSGRSV